MMKMMLGFAAAEIGDWETAADKTSMEKDINFFIF
jgi:hypothetical protein